MKKYKVKVQATITKWIEVLAESEQHAQEEAHNEFNANSDEIPEKYDEQVLEIKLIEQ